jgi:arginyl-tRNA synthetase
MLVREKLTAALLDAVDRLRASGDLPSAPPPDIRLTVPPQNGLGDFTTDLALSLARQSRRSPNEVAEAVVKGLNAPKGLVERVEVGSSGFISFHLPSNWREDAVQEALRQGDAYGRRDDLGAGRRTLVEFVSANPTGPLTVEHGRGAAIGDSLARLLEWSGHDVTREFYINDAGSQLQRFAVALEAWVMRSFGQSTDGRIPDGFQGEYIEKLATQLASQDPSLAQMASAERQARLAGVGREASLGRQKQTLERFNVRFDEWRSEQALHDGGRLSETVAALRDSGHTYETDGALWLHTSRFGDSEDRPLLRSNGRPTYLAADLAYHLEKLERGYQRLIDVWGPEHAGYVQRTRAGLAALGKDPAALEILIFENVGLRIDGLTFDPAARKNDPVSLDEVLDRLGTASARFHYLSQPLNQPLDLDLDIARRSEPSNPAWRLTEAARLAREQQGSAKDSAGEAGATLLQRVADFPDEVSSAARARDPHRLAAFAVETADAFLAVSNGGGSADAALAQATGIVLNNVMSILGMASDSA